MRALLMAWVLVLVGGSCRLDVPESAGPPRVEAVDAGSATPTRSGDHGALSLLTWNVEWLGDTDEGPSDEALQERGVLDVLRAHGTELMALQEVSSEAVFERILDALPGYGGVLSGYDWKQRTALLWDRARFEALRVRAISGLSDAGRPPLEVVLHDRQGESELRVVVIHAKAQGDAQSYEERRALASGLASELKRARPVLALIVLGDFNDRLQGSISAGRDTPYAAFTEDPAFATPTRVLNEPGAREASYATGSTLDHAVLSRELGARVDAASLNVLRDELLAQDPAFDTNVSDHFPVTLTLQ
ncbi:MAG TPA: endonuclease/exonuclease/phosphatase family protein [Polyangiales bacterium]|jgi:endonuclease/exonuclease/phosphatase family metal-dependent hydrolase|nr:endonuclease/exonuclease/phosphatase family protein [Polyangiales bacterium]